MSVSKVASTGRVAANKRTRKIVRDKAGKKIALGKGKGGVVTKKVLSDIGTLACGPSVGKADFTIDWGGTFDALGRTLWHSIFSKNANIAYGPGYYSNYLRMCFMWYIKKSGALQNSNDDIASMGGVFLPAGYAKFFRQNSTFKDPVSGYEMVVAEPNDPATIIGPTTIWPWGQFVVTGIEPTVVTNAATISVLGSIDVNAISEIIRSSYMRTVCVKDIKWGAISPEMFVWLDDTSHYKMAHWSYNISLLNYNAASAFNFYMQQSTELDIQVAIYNMLLSAVHDHDTVWGMLKANGYDPMLFRVAFMSLNLLYFTQICYAVWSSVTANPASQEFWPFLMFCWSYVFSFNSVVSSYSHPKALSNPEFRRCKVPWVLQYLAKQLCVKSGSTMYYYVALDTGGWNYVFEGANTLGLSQLGGPGFTINPISVGVPVAPTAFWSSDEFNANYTIFSWNFASQTYESLQSSNPALFTLSSVFDAKVVDCGCFGSYGNSMLYDDIVIAGFGTLSPQTLAKLYCTSPISPGACDIACALTWRQSITEGHNTVAQYNQLENSIFNNNIAKVVGYTMAASGTNAQVLQAQKGINAYVNKQAAGGKYEWLTLNKTAILQLSKAWVSTAPIVRTWTAVARQALVNSLPEYVPPELIMETLNLIGDAGIDMLAGALSTRKIGVATIRHDEL